MEQYVSIVKVLSGAIYLSSPMENMRSKPAFSLMDYALSCHFVEYKNNGKFWKFFWSKPKEYGKGEIFATDRMKEDLSADEHRYFNDAKDVEQTAMNSTFTLCNIPAFDCSLSFMYRQHFSSSTQAFMGGMVEDNPYGVNQEWMQKFMDYV